MSQQELKVLLIEDNPGDAFLIKFYLGESTSPVFHVSHSENVKGGLELLAMEKFDIILSDMNLPDSFGVETIKSILTNYPGNLVIVLTGLTDEEVGLETVRYGAQDFLVKGKFDGKVLISSVMFSFERFKLNKQIDNVSKQFRAENQRLESIQRMLNTGFVEFDPKTGEIYCSDYTSKLLSLPDRDVSKLGKRLVDLFSGNEIKDLIKIAVDENRTGEYTYKGRVSGRVFNIHYEGKDGKLFALIKPMPQTAS